MTPPAVPIVIRLYLLHFNRSCPINSFTVQLYLVIERAHSAHATCLSTSSGTSIPLGCPPSTSTVALAARRGPPSCLVTRAWSRSSRAPRARRSSDF